MFAALLKNSPLSPNETQSAAAVFFLHDKRQLK